MYMQHDAGVGNQDFGSIARPTKSHENS